MKIKKINKEILHQNRLIFPFFYVMIIFFGLIQVITNSGFIKQYLFIDFLVFFWLLILSGILLLVYYKNEVLNIEENSTVNAVFTFNKLIILPILFAFYFLKVIEAKHFPNFVYSTYHLQIDNLSYVLIASLYALLISFFLDGNNSFKSRNFILSAVKKYFPTLDSRFDSKIVLIIFFLILSINFEIKDLNDAVSNTFGPARKALHFSKLDKESRRRYQFSEIYDFVSFIKKNTPDNATILIPPQAFPWPMTGNILYFRYFLYPRHLLNGELYSLGPNFSDKVQYVLLAKGEEGLNEGITGSIAYDWPKFDVNAQKVIYITSYTSDGQAVTKEAVGSFNHLDPSYNHGWGLIVLDKKQ